MVTGLVEMGSGIINLRRTAQGYSGISFILSFIMNIIMDTALHPRYSKTKKCSSSYRNRLASKLHSQNSPVPTMSYIMSFILVLIVLSAAVYTASPVAAQSSQNATQYIKPQVFANVNSTVLVENISSFATTMLNSERAAHAWIVDTGSSNTGVYFSYSYKGSMIGTKPVLTPDSSLKRNIAIACDPLDGTVYVVWEDSRAVMKPIQIFISVSTDGGNSFSVPAPVSLSSAPQMYPSVAVSYSGVLVVAWFENNTVRAAWSNSQGLYFDGAINITDGFEQVNEPKVICIGSNVVVFWKEYSGSLWAIKARSSSHLDLGFGPPANITLNPASIVHYGVYKGPDGSIISWWDDINYSANISTVFIANITSDLTVLYNIKASEFPFYTRSAVTSFVADNLFTIMYISCSNYAQGGGGGTSGEESMFFIARSSNLTNGFESSYYAGKCNLVTVKVLYLSSVVVLGVGGGNSAGNQGDLKNITVFIIYLQESTTLKSIEFWPTDFETVPEYAYIRRIKDDSTGGDEKKTVELHIGLIVKGYYPQEFTLLIGK
ncbi:MAG: hypothetical protein QW728_03395, partial [Thermoplasmata archaeon]